MPETLTGDGATYDNTASVPLAGEVGAVAPIKTAFQRLLNNGKHLYDLVRTSGVLAVRHVASVAALQALTGMATGQVCLIDKRGPYYFVAGSPEAAVTNWVILPNDLSGTWFHWSYLLRNAAHGFAGLDANAKVPAAQITYGVIATYYDGTTRSLALSATETDITGSTFTFTGVVENELIEVDVAGAFSITANPSSHQALVRLTKADNTSVALATVRQVPDGDVWEVPLAISARYTVTSADQTAGSVTLKMREASTATCTGTALIYQLRARHIRP